MGLLVNDAVLEKLRRGDLNQDITSLVFDHRIFDDISDAKEDEVIDKLCESLELLKTNTHIRDLSIHCHLRHHKEDDDSKRVERAYVKFGEYLAANENIQELNINIDHWTEPAISSVAEGLRKNHSVNDLRFYTHNISSVTPEGADILAQGIRDNNTVKRLNIDWPLMAALSHNNTIEAAHISGYRISEEGEKALAETLRDNKTLREISIDALGKFEGGAGQILAEAVADNGALRKLSIYDRELSDEGIIVLAEALKTNQAITELSLGDILNGPNPGNAAALAIAEMIGRNTAIKTLRINGRIGEVGIQEIAEALKVNHTITRLDIRDISRAGAKALLVSLKENDSLEELVVPNLNPDDEDAKLIAEVLRKNTSLKVLSVADGTFGDVEGVAIANALKENNSLKTLDMHGNRNVGIEWAKALAEALQRNNTLENLNIDTCWGMKTEGAIAIVAVLGNNNSLRALSMSICPLEVSGAKALAQALRNNDTLRFLDICYTHIGGNEGAKAIAEALKVNRSLYCIGLSSCDLGDDGGVAIGEALKSNKGLLALDLGNNGLRDRGITGIAQGLEINDALRILDISSFGDERANRISDTGARSLRKSLEANHTLAVLNIKDSFNSGSWYVSQLVSEIAAGLRKNHTLAGLEIAFSTSGNELLSLSDKKALADAAIASGSKNIIRIYPYLDSVEWRELIEGNEDAVDALLKKLRETPGELTSEDLRNCEERIPAIFCQVKHHTSGIHIDTGVEEMADILDTLEKRAEAIKRQIALQLRRTTNDQVINDIKSYAEDNRLTFEQMCSDIALYTTDNLYRENAEAFAMLINGDYSLRDIDTLLEISNDENQRPAMIALRQFVNHSLIPHLDYFLIQALKTEDVSQVNSGDYPNVARVGGQPVLEAGITGFHEEVSAGYSKEIATKVEEETEYLNFSFLGDRVAGTIDERFFLAYTMVDRQTQEFEGMFEETKKKIIEIITQRDEKGKESRKKEQELIEAKKTNADIQERISVIAREIEEKDRISAARNTSRVGWSWVLGGLQITAAGITGNPALAITGISTIISGYMQVDADKEAASQEVANLNSRIDRLESGRILESSLDKQIEQLKQAIKELTESEVYQKKYGSAQKMEAVRKAYLAKYVLDFGRQNLGDVHELCDENGITSVDVWIEQFDSRLGTALTNFCFGYADSNDLSIILAEANAIPAGDDDPARTVLRELAEGCIKRSIAEHYSHAAQVDKIYQANLIGLGTNLHETRAMVRRETDRALAALIGYQHATEPVLIEGQYSARGARDISRVFAYWQHRHGDKVLDTSRLLDEHESSKFAPKRVTALPEGEQELFVERVKRAQAASNADAPEIGDDFLRVCAYEYIIPKFPHDIASGRRILSDNPQALAMYPVINATINNFIRALSMNSLDHYRQHVGERLDNLVAQTFIDFFAELGTQHIGLQKVVNVGDELEEAKTRPELFARIFEKYTRIVSKEANSKFDLFLEIYARNLEKMLEVAQSDDRKVLLEQIDTVHELAQGKLKPDVTMPGSDTARIKARNDNHTYENTSWKGGVRV